MTSQPPGRRVNRGALGAIAETLLLDHVLQPAPPPPPPPPPPRMITHVPVARPRSLHGVTSQPPGRRVNSIALGIFGDDAPSTAPTVTDPQWARDMVAGQRAMVAWQAKWVQRDEMQRWFQLAATLSIPLAAAIWKAIGLGRRGE